MTDFGGLASDATSTLPTCKELGAHWEEFFSSLSASTSKNSQEDDSDDTSIIEVNAQTKELKVKSMKEATAILEDLTESLTSENQTEPANNVSQVLSKIQSSWLSRRLTASVQSKVAHFFKCFRCMSIFKNSLVILFVTVIVTTTED